MENMGINKLFGGIYKNKKVLITGHTGFKGSWLSLWLNELGAELYGISLPPATHPSHYELLKLKIDNHLFDITDFNHLSEVIKSINPDIIFHLAAQPLVRFSYLDPRGTFLTNVIGTVNLLEASRSLSNLKAIIIITSDKCYENMEWCWGYRESDPLGGKDPYSASKACAELVTSSYRHSFFNLESNNKVLVASVRAGNVIGGGDWAADRIIPDIIKSAVVNTPATIRYPNSTRPWQHVLEPLSGYLLLGYRLLQGDNNYSGAWNFGPNLENNLKVIDLIKKCQLIWPEISYYVNSNNNPHEANLLMLDSSKAHIKLNWFPIWEIEKTVKQTISWYMDYYTANRVNSMANLYEYILDAKNKNVSWTLI